MIRKLITFFSREFGFYDDDKPYKIFRVYLFFASIITPLLTSTVYSESTTRYWEIDLSIEFSFLITLILSFFNSWVRNHLRLLFYIICFASSIYAFLNMYSSGYNTEDFMGFILAFFAISIGILDHRYTVIYSISFLLISIFGSLNIDFPTEVDPNGVIVLVFVVGLVCYIIHYTRYTLIRNLRDNKNEMMIGRDRLLTVLDSVDNIVYNVAIDEKGNRTIKYVSSAIEKVLGYSADEYITEVKAGRIIERIHPDDLPAVIEAGKRLNNDKEPVMMHYRFLSDKKGYIWLEEKVYPKIDHTGRHYANIGISSDVTLRMNNELELKRSEERYRLMVERNLAGFYRLDLDNIIIDCNDSLARIMGYSSGSVVIGKSISEVYADSTDKGSFIKLLKERNTILNHESQITLRNGKVKWLLENVSLIRNAANQPEYIEGTVFDITEMKEAEKRIRSAQQNLQMVIDNIDSLVYSLDIDESGNKHFHFVGPQIERLIGLSKEEYIRDVQSGKINELFHPDDLKTVAGRIKDLKNKKSSGIFTYRFWSKTKGEYIWLEEAMYPQFNEEGRLFRNFGVVRDVSETKKFEDAIKESERNLRILFERNLAGVFRTTVDGRILDCNEAFVKMFRYSSKEELLKGTSKDFYFDEKDRLDYLNALKKENVLTNYELKYKRKDGTEVWALLNVSLIEESNVLVGTIIDISGLKEAENKLLESKKSYEDLVEGSPYGIILHKEGSVIFANKASFEIVGLDKEGFGIDKFSIYDFLLPEYREESEIRRKRVLNGEDVPFIRIKIKDKKGNILDVETKSQLVSYEGENVIQTTLKNITIELQLEKEKLRAEIAEQTNRLLEEEIQEHKLTQEKLIEIQQFLQGIIGSSIDMIMASGVDMKIDMINTAALRAFGYTEEELIGVHPEVLYCDQNEFKKIQRSLEEQGSFTGEIVNRRKSGETFISYLSAALIKDPSGKIIGSMGVSRDITEIIEAERIVEEQNAKIKAIFENSSNMMMWTMDKDLQITSFNRIFGEVVKSVVGKTVETGDSYQDLLGGLTGPVFSRILRAAFANAFNGKAEETEGPLLGGNENGAWFEIFLNPILLDSGEIEEISCVAYDITERRKAQIELKISEERNAAMIRALPDLIFRMSKNGEYLDVIFKNRNDLADDPENFIGINILQHFPGEMGQRFLSSILHAITTGEVVQIEYSAPIRGHFRHFEARYSRINDQEALVVIRDISEKKEAENSLIDSLKEKEILLKEVHHRVKNNLQVISSILNLQSSYVKDENTLQILRESQNRIKSMSFIHESLYQTKMFSSVNFSDYIYDLSKNLVHSYQVFGDLVELDFRLGDVHLNLDQSIPCGLIVNELVSNALKYAFPNGRKGCIRIELREEGRLVTMGVQDNGVGLPEGFDTNATETLGLQLVSTLVEQIEGTMTLNSTPGKGTEYLITFEKIELNR